MTKKKELIDKYDLEKLKTACKMINESLMSFHYWKVDQIYPVNLYKTALERVVEIMDNIIFKYDLEEKSRQE